METILVNISSSSSQHSSCTRMRLPASIDSLKNKWIWAMSGDSSLPNKMGPTSMEQEGRIILTFIGELQLNFALDLNKTQMSSRNLGSKGEVGAASYLKVGSSNARRLEEGLKAKGILTGSVIPNNWRATKKAQRTRQPMSVQSWQKDSTQQSSFNCSTTTSSSPGLRMAACVQPEG